MWLHTCTGVNGNAEDAAELSAARLRTGSGATDAASTSSKINLASLGGESEPLYFYGEKFSR